MTKEKGKGVPVLLTHAGERLSISVATEALRE